ncbi:MAG: hypothetical protein LBJ58_01840 [Tannerellaceae bacterium]|jgi:hypothetical protein|nr:hypothetical protein [Tannerellaceae bacterium]
MESEELRKTWASIDQRLGKQELLNENIIRRMIGDRAGRSLGRLLGYEVLGFALYLCVISAIIFVYYFESFRAMTQLAGDIGMPVLLAICIASLAWSAIKIVGLMKVDFARSVKDNSVVVNRYNIQIAREKVASIVGNPLVCLVVIWMFATMRVDAFRWIILACALAFGVFLSYYTYKRLYDRNIASIRRCLEELKELEE